MKSITFYNRKGGVGKTTICALLARFFADIGMKVLCIDLDSQINLTSYCCGYDERDNVESVFSNTIADVICGENDININDAIYQAGEYDEEGELPEENIFKNLYFVPGTSLIDKVDKELSNDYALLPQFIIQNKLRELDDSWDIIMQDCSPGERLTTIMSLASSDFVIKPVHPDRHSLNGVKDCNKIISQVSRTMNSQLKDLGCVINNYKCRENMSKVCEDYLGEDFSGFTIRNTSKVPQAIFLKEGIVNARKYNNRMKQDGIANDYILLGEYILKNIKG